MSWPPDAWFQVSKQILKGPWHSFGMTPCIWASDFVLWSCGPVPRDGPIQAWPGPCPKNFASPAEKSVTPMWWTILWCIIQKLLWRAPTYLFSQGLTHCGEKFSTCHVFFFSPALGGPWVRVIAVRPQHLGPLVPDSRFQSGFWKLCGIAFEWHHASGHLTLWDWAVAQSLWMDRFRPGPALQKWPNFTSLDRCDPNVMDHFAMHHFVALLMIFEVKELWQVYHIGVKSCAPSTKPHFGQKWRFSWCPPKSKFGPNLDSHGVLMVSGAFRDLCWVTRSKFSNLIIRWST